MPGYGGFYKGEKKKTKKDTKKSIFSNAPVLLIPEIIQKKKKDY